MFPGVTLTLYIHIVMRSLKAEKKEVTETVFARRGEKITWKMDRQKMCNTM